VSQGPGSGSDYAFGPAVRLRVHGSRSAIAHFAREFGPRLAPVSAPEVEVDVRFGWPRGGRAGAASGSYKSVRWRVELSCPDDHPLCAEIVLSGGPPSFALSLVQGYFVEPLVALALVGEGYVALPGAGLAIDEGALLLMGPSGSGKSSLSMHALGLGHSLLGDDQVLLDGQGGCRPYPRRLRVYPDIRDTAPEAWLRLCGSTRRTLTVRRAVRRLTRGFVAPSLAVPMTEIGPAAPPGPLPLKRLLVVERTASVRDLDVRPRDSAWAVERAGTILADQRSRLVAIADEAWRRALSAAGETEIEIFRRAIAAAPIDDVRVPDGWESARAVKELARQAGL
jgi:energy-coupling factor transporter ATP-binding protein EcfA2